MKLPAFFRKRRRTLFIRLVANGVGQAIMTVAIAILVRLVFEWLAASPWRGVDETFAWMIGGLLVATGGSVVLRILERLDAERLAENYVTRVRLRLFDALTSGPVLTMQRRGLGPTMLRFVTDLTAVRQWVGNGLARLIVAPLAAAGGLVAICIIDPLVGSVISAIVAVAILSGALLGRPLEAAIRRTRRRRSQLASHVGDRLRALNVVQLSGQTRRERGLIFRRSRNLEISAIARARLASIVRVLPDAALGLSTVAVLAIGGARLAEGGDGYGTIIVALTVLGAVTPQARALGRVFEYWKTYRVATEKLNEIIRGAAASRKGREKAGLAPVRGKLDFNGISVRGALSDVTATAEEGKLIAVVGPSGAGKSSLLATAARLLRLDAGTVLLDGQDISTFSAVAYARNVGMVSRDFPLLKGSLRRNLTYRIEDASEEEVAHAFRLCDLDHEIERLPQGLGTRVSEDGSDLPLGLRQRVCLARAILGGPVVLLLDDPDAGLDASGRAALDRILSSRRYTVLVATHAPERVRSADAVWYLDRGRLVEAGTPTSILAADGPTARYFEVEGRVPPTPALAQVRFLRKDDAVND